MNEMISTVTYKGHRLVIRHEGVEWIVTIVGPFESVIRRASRSVALKDARTLIDRFPMRSRLGDRARTRSAVR